MRIRKLIKKIHYLIRWLWINIGFTLHKENFSDYESMHFFQSWASLVISACITNKRSIINDCIFFIKLRNKSFHWYESTNKIIFHSYTISTCFQNMSYHRKEKCCIHKSRFSVTSRKQQQKHRQKKKTELKFKFKHNLERQYDVIFWHLSVTKNLLVSTDCLAFPLFLCMQNQKLVSLILKLLYLKAVNTFLVQIKTE